MCSTDFILRWLATLLGAALLGLFPLSAAPEAPFVGADVAAAQQAAAPPQSTICCKPGDANCAPREYAINSPVRVALVVGVDDYGQAEPASNRPTNLKNARNDAQELARILSNSYVVRCILDPDAQTFKDELKKLADFLVPLQADQTIDLQDNSVIVHFSGHGFRDTSINTDFVLLSGSFATKAEVLKAAVSVFQVSDALEELTFFDTHLVFDSCRNRSDQAVANLLGFTGFGEPQTYTKHGHTIVFGARENEFSFDRHEGIGAKNNGALIFTLSKYFGFPAMRLREIYEVAMGDPTMVQIGQRPIVSPGRVGSEEPWTTHQQICSASEKVVARQVIDCRLSGGTSCVDTHVCKKDLRSFDDFIRKIGGPTEACSRKRLFDTFSELAKRCGPEVDAPAQAMSDAAAHAHLTALVSDSTARFADNEPLRSLFATADKPTAARSVETQGRPFLQAQRRILNVPNPFSVEDTAMLQVATEGPVELRLRPSEGAATTGRLQATAKPRVDCNAHPCTTNWAFVRVPTAAGNVDGWLPTSHIRISEPSNAIAVDFKGDDFVATRESRKQLRALDESIRAAAAVEVLVEISPQAEPAAQALAAARLAYVKNILTGTLKSQQVNTRTLNSGGAAGQITVKLFRP
jgi:hypothetical protein